VLADPRKLKGLGNFGPHFPGVRSHGRSLAPQALAPRLTQDLTNFASSSHSGGWRLTFLTSRVQAGCETTCSWPSVPGVGADPDPGDYSQIIASDQMQQLILQPWLCHWLGMTSLETCSIATFPLKDHHTPIAPYSSYNRSMRGEHLTLFFFQPTISSTILSYPSVKLIYFFPLPSQKHKPIFWLCATDLNACFSEAPYNLMESLTTAYASYCYCYIVLN